MEVKAQMGKPTRKLTSASKRVCLVALEGDFFLPSLRLQLQENPVALSRIDPSGGGSTNPHAAPPLTSGPRAERHTAHARFPAHTALRALSVTSAHARHLEAGMPPR